ncbi:MAG: hypothetical protein IJN67_12970 [Oscillospiraceae bacterium]|nr:hypothetical protein [Oscillospiraceae bacterium]
MGKKDFDIEFDFDEEFGFDPKSFLGTEDYDKNMDLNTFSDEELGLTRRMDPVEEDDAADTDDFDLDEEMSFDDFLNMGSEEEEEDQETFVDEVLPEEEETELPEETEPEEIAMDENMEYTEDEELLEQPAYEEETEYEDEEAYEEESEEEVYEFDEDDEDEDDEEPVKKPRKQFQMPKVTLPKITLPKLKTPNIFTKFYDLYFAPVLDKNWQNPEDPVQDPDAPRRRRRKTKAQVFKEVYLPPIIACVCLVLVLSFLIGSLSNVIEQRRIAKDAEESRLQSSISAAEQQQQAALIVAAEAERLAAGYDYQAAIDKLDSLGNLNDFPELNEKRAEYANEQIALVPHQDPSTIPNLSFHVLIEDMARAKKDTELGGKYNRNFVTTAEFSKILQQLYDNGYVLVDFNSFVGSSTDVNGNEKFEIVPMYLPADKKPVMITETMVNYFEYMIDSNNDGLADAQGDGFASRLVLDGNGDIKAEYVNAEGQTLVGNYDLVPILEDFIKAHPDFSYRGARAILAVTGDEGVFGYRCNTEYIGSKSQSFYDQEVAGAKKIADALRAKGYTLASYTYANKKYADMNANNIKADMGKWEQEVTSVIGPMNVFVFAQQSNLTDYTGTSFDVMYQAGFRFFIANATNATSATTTVNQTYVRQNRLMVTGNSMAWNPSLFTGMFNCSAVLDTAIRGDVPNG